LPGACAAAAFAVTAAVGWLACTATNYLDPEGPRYYDTSRSAKPSAAQEGPLRLVTFNIEFGRAVDGAIRLLRTTEALRDPDVLLLQEMSSAGVATIADKLGLNSLYFPSGIHPHARQEYGTAILSPWPIEDPAKLPLPYGAVFTGMRRAVTAATIRWGEHPVRVYCVHLPARMAISGGQRSEQVTLILNAARRDPGPVIVAGDFNSHDIDMLFEREGFQCVTKAIPGTSRFWGRWFQIDHIFARGLGAAGGAPAAGYVEAPGVSDHRAVWTRLRLAALPARASAGRQ
jgi:endonuclease/exonuclease/phosphatase family metal-dependent hydrolase